MPRMLSRLLTLLAALLLIPAAVAVAKSGASAGAAKTTPTTTVSTTTSTTTTTTPKPKPKPKPKTGRLTLHLPGAFSLGGSAVTIPGRAVTVEGVVHPYVAHQKVLLKAYLGHRLIKQVHLTLKASKRRSFGWFKQDVVSPGAGAINVYVTHDHNDQLGKFGTSRRWSALDTNVHFGSLGRLVQLAQQRLAALHFYVHQSGVYDGFMGLALDAYHRLLGWGTSQSLDYNTMSALLEGRGSRIHARYGNHGHHAEGWLAKQLLFLADGSNIRYIFPISSGKPSTPTVLGNFHIYRRDTGYLPDGMYYSSFFTGGYAIHGYNPAPDYPASHGCMRTPIVDAVFIFYWLRMNDAVDVYP
jgi:L,D-transpeptidase catalytic domain